MTPLNGTTKKTLLRAACAAALIAVLAGLLPAPALAQDGGTGSLPAANCVVRPGTSNVNVRYGPGTDTFGVIGVLYAGQQLPVIGQNAAGDWYAVTFAAPGSLNGPQEGWVSRAAVRAEGAACGSLPVLDEPGDPAEVAFLSEIPVLPELDVAWLREIHAHGLALGNDPHVFTKVGDCNTDTSFFMAGFDRGDYDLGPYDELEPSIAYFAGSFEHVSLAGQVGFNAMSMLDPMWANPAQCEPSEGEGPLACEYRRERPSVAVMMFGPNDLINLTEEQYAEALRDIIALSLDQGVIPVLSTFTWHRDQMWYKALRLNAITVEIADEYNLPLINFWRAAQDLPNLGLVTDYTHLTSDGGPLFGIRFNGEETYSGYALRNLVTLQTLDMLRREVLAAS